ncbi:MAG TPA: ATP-binding protein [Draconibacterium sp.]|nr:ATP-binding protein [Draconibacterium sp.]
MKKYPFKFLDAYNSDDTGIFFGRDEEIAALYEMVFQSPIILVYGASGTGKTSLIQCGLASRFQSHDWLALSIRRGSNINSSLEKALADAGGKSTEKEDLDWLNEIMEEQETEPANKNISPLEKSFKNIYLNSFRPIYLIFDQFEELFILGTKNEQTQFINTVKEILQVKQSVKMIFSIREEYLGHLNAFEKAVPQLLRKKLRVEPMNLDKVKQVIVGATSFENSNVRLRKGETDEIAEGIFDKIKGSEKTLTIQLPYLQVFLDKFYLEITNDETRNAEAVFTSQSLNKIGDIGDVMKNFLEEQVTGISMKLSMAYSNLTVETIWKILSPFATLEGTKEPITKLNLTERLPDLDLTLIDATVEALINSRILRYSDDVAVYEIAHDSLAKRIAEKRSDEEIALLEIRRLIKSQVHVQPEVREFFTEKQLLFIEPYLDKFKVSDEEQDWINKSKDFLDKLKKARLLEEEKKRKEKAKRFRQRIITIAAVVLAILAFLIYYSINSRQREIEALNAQEKAETAELKTKELLHLVVQGRGKEFTDKNYDEVVEMLRRQQTYPIDSLIVPRAKSEQISGSKNYDFLIWIDVPSFRLDEIKQVVYTWPCSGFSDKVHIGKEPSMGFAFGYRGWGYCPHILINVEYTNGSNYNIDFAVGEYLENHPN